MRTVILLATAAALAGCYGSGPGPGGSTELRFYVDPSAEAWRPYVGSAVAQWSQVSGFSGWLVLDPCEACITVRVGSTADNDQTTEESEPSAYFSKRRQVIVIEPAVPPGPRLVLHEVGHAFGATHSMSADVMCWGVPLSGDAEGCIDDGSAALVRGVGTCPAGYVPRECPVPEK